MVECFVIFKVGGVVVVVMIMFLLLLVSMIVGFVCWFVDSVEWVCCCIKVCIEIFDFICCCDEIGYFFGVLCDMMSVFYSCIEVIEMFVVDVVYELKNLLILLCLVVEMLLLVCNEISCVCLFEVIEYDVKWFDCLIFDIFDVSCFDVEL